MRTPVSRSDERLVWVAGALVSAIPVAAWWSNHWMYDGWSFPRTGLGRLLGADGECSHDVVEIQMFALAVAVLIPCWVFALPRVGPAARRGVAYFLSALWAALSAIWLYSAFVAPFVEGVGPSTFLVSVCETNLYRLSGSIPPIVWYEALAIVGAVLSTHLAVGCFQAGRRITSP